MRLTPKEAKMRILSAISVAVVLISGGAPGVMALSYITVADHHLSNQADLVVYGEISGSGIDTTGIKVRTRYTLAVREVLRGEFLGSRLEVRVLGGIDTENGIGLQIPGAPEFEQGQRVLLFLRAEESGSFRVLHFQQGAFYEKKRGGERFFTRPVAELHDLVIAELNYSAANEAPLVREKEAFLSWLRNSGVALPGLETYLILKPTADESAIISEPFTLIGGKNNRVLRWPNFDPASGDGLPRGAVRWDRHRNGPSGVNEKKALKNGTLHWKKRSMSPINYRLGGKRKSTNGFGPIDGRNMVLWKDLSDDIDTDFDCTTMSGTLAVGGISGIWGPGPFPAWKGRLNTPTSEAEVVFNNGVACFLKTLLDWEKVITHELGHTLGMGHTCDDGSSPKCRLFGFLGESIMAANFDRTRPNARPSQEDKRAARFLYDQSLEQIPCHLKPGHKKFCKRCGPCGEGQGKCKKNSQCHTDLTCTKDAGGDYGLKDSTDVCTP